MNLKPLHIELLEHRAMFAADVGDALVDAPADDLIAPDDAQCVWAVEAFTCPVFVIGEVVFDFLPCDFLPGDVGDAFVDMPAVDSPADEFDPDAWMVVDVVWFDEPLCDFPPLPAADDGSIVAPRVFAAFDAAATAPVATAQTGTQSADRYGFYAAAAFAGFSHGGDSPSEPTTPTSGGRRRPRG